MNILAFGLGIGEHRPRPRSDTQIGDGRPMTRVTTESREDIENHDHPASNVHGGNRRHLRASS
jgi:hypothetical protein